MSRSFGVFGGSGVKVCSRLGSIGGSPISGAGDKGFGLACQLLELSRRFLLVDVLFPVCLVDRRRVVPAMTLQSWSRWI